MVNLTGVFVVGMLLAWMFLRSRNVILVGFIHGGMNAPLVGPLGDIGPVLLFLVLLEGLYWAEKRRKKRLEREVKV